MTNKFPEEDFFEAETQGISFHIEELDFELKDAEKIESWILLVVEQASAQILSINYIFCSDEYLHKINLEHLKHDTYTDIITFQYGDNQSLESDIFISIERVRENAQNHGQRFEQELRRVIIHGVLHLLGQKDKSSEQATQMRQKEESALSLFDFTFS